MLAMYINTTYAIGFQLSKLHIKMPKKINTILYSRKVWWRGFGEFTLQVFGEKKLGKLDISQKVIYCNWMVLVSQITDNSPNFLAIWYVCVKVWLYRNFISDHWKNYVTCPILNLEATTMCLVSQVGESRK